jgi:hypothetical protein
VGRCGGSEVCKEHGVDTQGRPLVRWNCWRRRASCTWLAEQEFRSVTVPKWVLVFYRRGEAVKLVFKEIRIMGTSDEI